MYTPNSNNQVRSLLMMYIMISAAMIIYAYREVTTGLYRYLSDDNIYIYRYI